MNEFVSAPLENKVAADLPDPGSTSTKTPVLQVEKLTRVFGKLFAVNDISFTAQPGEVIGFIGPNGAGKTTTMRIIATLDIPTHGDVFVCGHSVTDHPDRVRKFIGYMPDSFGKYANMSVMDYLDFFARAYGLRGRQRQSAIDHVMVFTELRKLQHKPIKTLSKGQSQRLGLGRTLIHNPPLMILDEPAAGLDPRARVELRELVYLLARELNKTVLISSHILTELGEICDSVVIIEAGNLLASGKVADIQRRNRAEKNESHSSLLSVALMDECDVAARETAMKWILQQPLVETCRDNGSRLVIEFTGNQRDQHDLLKRMLDQGFLVTELSGKIETLEDAFMGITRGIMQ